MCSVGNRRQLFSLWPALSHQWPSPYVLVQTETHCNHWSSGSTSMVWWWKRPSAGFALPSSQSLASPTGSLLCALMLCLHLSRCSVLWSHISWRRKLVRFKKHSAKHTHIHIHIFLNSDQLLDRINSTAQKKDALWMALQRQPKPVPPLLLLCHRHSYHLCPLFLKKIHVTTCFSPQMLKKNPYRSLRKLPRGLEIVSMQYITFTAIISTWHPQTSQSPRGALEISNSQTSKANSLNIFHIYTWVILRICTNVKHLFSKACNFWHTPCFIFKLSYFSVPRDVKAR